MQEENYATHDFFSRLETAVRKRGWRFSKLSSESGIALSTIYRWKNGSIPQSRTQVQLAQLLGVREDWLTNGQGPMSPGTPLLQGQDTSVITAQDAAFGVLPGGKNAPVETLATEVLFELLEGMPHSIATATNAAMKSLLVSQAEAAAKELRRRLKP